MEPPVLYKGAELPGRFRIDLLVNELVVVEIKAVERLGPIHEAQVLTYLKLTNKKLALVFNFNSTEWRVRFVVLSTISDWFPLRLCGFASRYS